MRSSRGEHDRGQEEVEEVRVHAARGHVRAAGRAQRPRDLRNASRRLSSKAFGHLEPLEHRVF